MSATAGFKSSSKTGESVGGFIDWLLAQALSSGAQNGENSLRIKEIQNNGEWFPEMLVHNSGAPALTSHFGHKHGAARTNS